MKDRPRDTSLRDAFVGILVTVGPFFGVRYQRPHVEVPVVSTPGTEDDAAQGLTSAPRTEPRADEGEGIVL